VAKVIRFAAEHDRPGRRPGSPCLAPSAGGFDARRGRCRGARSLRSSSPRAGGFAAAAAFLKRSSVLTPESAGRAGRALAAAEAKQQAGALDEVLALVEGAKAGPLDEFQRAKADVLRARLSFATDRGSEAPPLLLGAAKRLEPLDVPLAREIYLDALTAAVFAGRLAGDSDARKWLPRHVPPPLHRVRRARRICCSTPWRSS
jgi:hypothetical protein